ncbi:Fc.00g082370.m01.CDS01 [Cosmosporella sp. VM-42]
MASNPSADASSLYTAALQQLIISYGRIRNDAYNWRDKALNLIQEKDHYKSACHTLRLHLDEERQCRVVLDRVIEAQRQEIRRLEAETIQLQHNLASMIRYGPEHAQSVKPGSSGPSTWGILPEATCGTLSGGDRQGPADVSGLATATKRKAEDGLGPYQLLSRHREWPAAESDQTEDELPLPNTQPHEDTEWVAQEA